MQLDSSNELSNKSEVSKKFSFGARKFAKFALSN